MQLLLLRIAAVLVALVVAFGAGYYKRGQLDRLEAEAQAKASLEQTRATEQRWQQTFDDNTRNLVHELNSIAADRDRAVGELRQRPQRAPGVSEAPRTECQGGTGAELSGPDAEFLAWEAARADEQRAALMACYIAFDALK